MRHQVDPFAVQVARHLTVIEADIGLLRDGIAQQSARLQVELLDLDIARQFAPTQVMQVVEFRTIAVDPLQEGPEQALLQLAARRRAAEGQRCINGQRALRLVFDALVQGIDETNGFTQTKRQAQADRPVDLLQHPIDGLFKGAGKHRMYLLDGATGRLWRPQKRPGRPKAAWSSRPPIDQRPDIFWIAAFSSSSEQSPQVPFGGMALMPLMALVNRPSRPPLAPARAVQSALSPIFGAPSTPGVWQAPQCLAIMSSPLRGPLLAAAATAPTPLHSSPWTQTSPTGLSRAAMSSL